MMPRKDFIVKVSSKGQIVIPVEIRRRFNIKDKVLVRVEGNEIKIIPIIPLEDLFGVDGDAMRDVAREIVEERRAELRLEQ